MSTPDRCYISFQVVQVPDTPWSSCTPYQVLFRAHLDPPPCHSVAKSLYQGIWNLWLGVYHKVSSNMSLLLPAICPIPSSCLRRSSMSCFISYSKALAVIFLSHLLLWFAKCTSTSGHSIESTSSKESDMFV